MALTRKFLKALEIEGDKADQIIEAAESALSRGERIEIIPVKNGVKIVRIRREEIKIGEKVYK